MANGTGKWTTAHLVQPYGIVIGHEARLNDKAVVVIKHSKGWCEIDYYTKGTDGWEKREDYIEASVREAKAEAHKWLTA